MNQEEVLRKINEGGIKWAMEESVRIVEAADDLDFVPSLEDSVELALVSTATYCGLIESGPDKLAGILDDLIKLGYSYGYRAGKKCQQS